MGAFFLLRRPDAPGGEARRDALLDTLAHQGFHAPRRFVAADYAVYLYDKLSAAHENAYCDAPDSFCLSVGTFFYRGRIGREALREFHRAFDPAAIPWDDVAGQFCLIVAKHGALYVLGDRIGLFKTYRTSDAAVVSSSFLATAGAATRRTIDWQSLYEYVLLGAAYGNRTVFDEVAQVDPDALLCLGAAGATAVPHPAVVHEVSELPFAELLAINLDTLRRYFAMLSRAFGNRISTALSAGYDSRLMLALLRACGVAPYVYVYGRDDDRDVQIARRIAAGEGFPLAHTDKQAGAPVPADELAAIVERNLHFFDGTTYAGIFDDGVEVRTREERCRDGRLVLNGMHGDVYRRPEFANRPFDALEVVWRKYCGFDPAVCTSRFQPPAYCAALADKIKRALRAEDPLSRADVTWTIPTFFARYWAGGAISGNNRLSPALLPFCDLTVVRDAVRLPIAYRSYGRFQAALIRAVDPRLAAYPSGYDHDFASPPPRQRIVQEWLATVRSPIHFRFRARPQAERPYYLREEYVARALDPGFPYLRRFFHLERVCDAQQFNRICTLEYLFQKFSPCDT